MLYSAATHWVDISELSFSHHPKIRFLTSLLISCFLQNKPVPFYSPDSKLSTARLCRSFLPQEPPHESFVAIYQQHRDRNLASLIASETSNTILTPFITFRGGNGALLEMWLYQRTMCLHFLFIELSPINREPAGWRILEPVISIVAVFIT